MTPAQIEFYKRLAHGLALQFGPNCEVVVHDLETEDVDHSIVVIENGHVSGRKLGDGPSHIVLESMHEGTADVHDREPYLTKTADGKLLKSSTIFIRNDEGKPVGILGINFDITLMKAFERSLDAFTGTGGSGYTEPEPITKNIGDLLEDLVKVGDELDLIVEKVMDQDGVIQLSRKKLASRKGMEEIAKAAESGEVVEGDVTEFNKGGVVDRKSVV